MSFSLRRRLSLWLAVVTIAGGMAAGACSFYLAFREAQDLQDDQLRQAALLVERSGKTPTGWVIPAGPANNDDPEERIIVALLGETGQSHGRPNLPADMTEGFQTLTDGGNTWRLFVHTLPSGRRLAVGQLTTVRNEVARSSALLTMVPILLLGPALALLAAWVIRHGLRPVTRLSQELDCRDDTNLQQIAVAGVPGEIAPFVDSINGLMQRLATALEQQRRFIADAAHELRSPLTALSVQAENLEHGLATPDAGERVAQLQAGLERARKLLEQLLNLARHQSGAAPAEAVAFDKLLRHVIEDAMPLAAARQIDLGCRRLEPITLVAPAEDLAVLVRNAIDNALRYSPAGGTIDVSLYREDDTAILLVEDTGPGIPAKALGHLFEPFYRVTGTGTTGSGLGLAIVRSVAERLGGRVTLDNRTDGPGARFCYRQPLPPAPLER